MISLLNGVNCVLIDLRLFLFIAFSGCTKVHALKPARLLPLEALWIDR
jgi:hypothetical protein